MEECKGGCAGSRVRFREDHGRGRFGASEPEQEAGKSTARRFAAERDAGAAKATATATATAAATAAAAAARMDVEY